MGPIIAFLEENTLPEESSEARKLRREAAKYTIVAGKLYKRSLENPLLKCLTPRQAEYVMAKIHEGIYGTHIALAAKTILAGYYWRTLKTDCMESVKKCDKCQKHVDLHQASPEFLHSILSPLSFSMWGVDILRPFPLAPG